MSDGMDPRHVPYFRRKRAPPDLDEWSDELTYELIKMGAIRSDADAAKVTDEIKIFAVQVVRAARDGHFEDVPQRNIPWAAFDAWKRGEQGTACGYVCSHPRRVGNIRSGLRVGCGNCDPCKELARLADLETA